MNRFLVGFLSLAGLTILLGATAPTAFDAAPSMEKADSAAAIHSMEMTKIMKKCKMCHGKDLMGKQKKKKKTPGVLGLSKADILKSMTTDIPKPMKAIAKALTDEEKNKVSDLISKMPKPAAPSGQ